MSTAHTTTGRSAAVPLGTNGSPPRHRTPARRRPSPRAAVGALLVALAVGGTLVAIDRSDDGPRSRLVVATRSFAPGERLSADGLEVARAELPPEVTARSFAHLSSVEGGVAIHAITAGELVQVDDVAVSPIDEELGPVHEMSLALDRDRALDGELQPGERVDLVATYGSAESATTLVVAADAVVISAASDDAGIGSAGTVTLTLALASEQEILRSAHASEVASIRLVRATRTEPGIEPADPYTGPGGATTTPAAGDGGGG